MNTAEQLNPHASLLDLITDLVKFSDAIPDAASTMITGVQLDSRLLRKGDLFLACFGRNHDARDYIDKAIDVGVAAILADADDNWQGVQVIRKVPIVAIDNLPAKISEIAARFYSCPSEKLTVIGITGTNGKTSCSQFIAQALTEANFKCGLIGTLGYGIYGSLKETQLTTPDAVFTQVALAEMVLGGVDPVVMEVSSVGLHQKRVKKVQFETAIFTNLTRDHLDYHGSMEAYAENKKKLFTARGLKHAIVNLDDPYALSIINSIAKGVEVSTYSIKKSIATVYAEELSLNRHGFEARLCTPIGNGIVKGKLIGHFNFSNLLAVTAALISYLSARKEVKIDELCRGISNLKPVTGRMEIVGNSEEITAVVDYAHTPDGLRSALSGLRDHFDGNIWCVFGCGGNRDKGKRPMMGEIAEKYADRLIIADDNPRQEKGDEIVQHILSGINNKSAVTVLRDRAQAIGFAIGNARAGDVVLVAGKGHETYQDIGGNKLIFSDANQVRLALQKRSRN
ncbi:MAG TPA: UDP-N-acetylmuramoyl-L-alanyl-D-glutamate--2,6-diaminopimelate ligase [Gammaproteobacteria bacterium]|jgi:UDP-N-acetylmuramoyl-L-alanyl-D-glutamate--2,6-diaminopimelate ligase|nr:UDP-N-acetylmuramoyl-L-alanyl-D-glutamate--2,6-diaminopimelate ligase [Gammaproteobacteria bacterium]HAT27565.1 UDP-N-acetylmuramoyl-L-alanyl-D-glutamate--2,6-diaminopimelate ligase [Gammaproteobacteria bacterium]|tara:strand:+ start:3072 stop:4604 length:1533 start_codon:yes stop_codon:yes gene_type:complete